MAIVEGWSEHRPIEQSSRAEQRILAPESVRLDGEHRPLPAPLAPVKPSPPTTSPMQSAGGSHPRSRRRILPQRCVPRGTFRQLAYWKRIVRRPPSRRRHRRQSSVPRGTSMEIHPEASSASVEPHHVHIPPGWVTAW